MLSQITQISSDYYSFGQYFFHTSSDTTRDESRIIDDFIASIPYDKLESIITTMSANLNGIMSDKRNNRVAQSAENASKTSKAKVYSTYNLYIQDMCEQQISPNMIPSLYSHIQGDKEYFVVIDPKEEPSYEYKHKTLRYGELLKAILEQSKNSNADVHVPSLEKNEMLGAVLMAQDYNDVAMKTVVLDPDILEEGSFLAAQLKDGTTDKRLAPEVRRSEFLKKDGPLAFRDSRHHVNVVGSNIIHHAGLDRHGVLNNGQIAKAYYSFIGLDPSAKSDVQKKHFENTLKRSDEWTYWNPSWQKGLTKELTDALYNYWFVLIPGSEDIVLRFHVGGKVSLWESKLIPTFLLLLNRLHVFYSLVHLISYKSVKSVLNDLILKNGLVNMRPVIKFSFKLFKSSVKIPVNVSIAISKSGNRLFTVANQLMNSSLYSSFKGDDDSGDYIPIKDNIDDIMLFDDEVTYSGRTESDIRAKNNSNDRSSNKEKEYVANKYRRRVDENPFGGKKKEKKKEKRVAQRNEDDMTSWFDDQDDEMDHNDRRESTRFGEKKGKNVDVSEEKNINQRNGRVVVPVATKTYGGAHHNSVLKKKISKDEEEEYIVNDGWNMPNDGYDQEDGPDTGHDHDREGFDDKNLF